jgi:hypothetical protein
MRMAASLIRNAVQQRRGRIGIAPHTDRKAKQKQRFDVIAIVADELPADGFRLGVLPFLQQIECDAQPPQPFRDSHRHPPGQPAGQACTLVA